ncbi:MAG: DUF3883 domain-containing protein [Longimicrobiales bacterium]
MTTERRDWSRLEVEAVVADYFDMLHAQLRGRDYVKTEHRRRLIRQLDRRSEGSVEYKHQNISAVLRDLRLPWIEGYKPASNYQDLLFEVVRERAESDDVLLALVEFEVGRQADVPTVDDILARLVGAPHGEAARRYGAVRDRPSVRPRFPDYLLQEARNASLGAAGERFVINFERARLLSRGEEALALRGEHVSRSRGDHEGFDVLSFETDGRERLIEVKTTAFGALTPFYVSENQVRRSQECRDQFQVYRVFRFRRDPHLFALPGAIDRSCDLEPREYVARPA